MDQHTPGPWVADIERGYGFPFRLTPNIPINPVVMGHPVNRSIAKIWRGYQGAKANARLIAAAPDMLTALRKAAVMLAGVCVHSPELEPHETYEAVSAAIAKATGAQA